MDATKKFSDLVELVKILRKECPWDRRQTHESIKDNLIEEAYETVEAIDEKDFDELKKELGDLLLHVIFHSRMAEETEKFTIEEVIHSLQEKLIRRHPHVFGDAVADNEKQVAENWENIKMKEGRKSILDGIPGHLPALIRAQRMQEKAANVGFDWPQTQSGKQKVWEKLEEEISELKKELEKEDADKSRDEFGDLLFSLVNVGRFYNLNAEDSLRQTNKKFITRFQHIERELRKEDKNISDVTLEEMDRHWNEAKSESDNEQ